MKRKAYESDSESESEGPEEQGVTEFDDDTARRKSNKYRRDDAGDEVSDNSDSELDSLDDEEEFSAGNQDTSDDDDETEDEEIENNPNKDQPEEVEVDIPLGQIIAIKQDGSTTAEALKARARAAKLQSKKASFKRDSKHMPSEISSKKPVSIFRDTMQTGKRQSRDPRFDSLTGGKFSDGAFKKRYAFIYDDKLPEERKQLKEALQKTKSIAKKEQLKAELARVTQQIKTEQARRKQKELEKSVVDKQKETLQDGQKPFYMKKSVKKKEMLVAKYEQLKESGQLDKYMEKRRKRNAAKDHRFVPRSRRDNEN